MTLGDELGNRREVIPAPVMLLVPFFIRAGFAAFRALCPFAPWSLSVITSFSPYSLLFPLNSYSSFMAHLPHEAFSD